jgi:hypothetical protein
MLDHLNHAAVAWAAFLVLLFFAVSTDYLISKTSRFGISLEILTLLKWSALILCLVDVCGILWFAGNHFVNLLMG